MATPRQPIAAPEVAEPIGLRASVGAAIIDTTGSDELDPCGNWVKGYELRGEVCGVHSMYVINPAFCDDDGNLLEVTDIAEQLNDPDAPFDSFESCVPGMPFVVGTGIAAQAMGQSTELNDWRNRARRRLQLCEWSELAHELWTGDKQKLDATNDDDDIVSELVVNRYLASPNAEVITGGPYSVVEGMAQMEASLGACTCGGPRVIHVSPYLIDHLKAKGLIEARGERWRTPNGNWVVSDDGYPGTGPDTEAGTPAIITPAAPNGPGESWMYGTMPIVVKWGDVRTPDTDLGWESAMRMRDNSVIVRAERFAMASWLCCHYAVQIDTTITP
jgi:hypothetical protein